MATMMRISQETKDMLQAIKLTHRLVSQEAAILFVLEENRKHKREIDLLVQKSEQSNSVPGFLLD